MEEMGGLWWINSMFITGIILFITRFFSMRLDESKTDIIDYRETKVVSCVQDIVGLFIPIVFMLISAHSGLSSWTDYVDGPMDGLMSGILITASWIMINIAFAECAEVIREGSLLRKIQRIKKQRRRHAIITIVRARRYARE